MFNRKEMRIASLERQMEILETIRNRHLNLLGEIQNPDVKELHMEIINTIDHAVQEYQSLLETYYRQQD